MAAVSQLNSKAELFRHNQALTMNLNASHSLADILKTNLGPAGTLKMLVGGAGDVQLTKDGRVLLKNLTIIHPTAMMISRTAIAQDDNCGDGTTSSIILIDGILKQCERRLAEGVHPRVLTTGLEDARDEALRFLEEFKTVQPIDRDLLLKVARTSLNTKLPTELVDQLTEIVTDSVLAIKREGEPVNLFMVEQLTQMSKLASDTALIRGLVLDHGFRHPLMKKDMHNVYILTCNVSLEFENTEVNTQFSTNAADMREKMADAERKFVDSKVNKIIELKNKVCKNGEDFLVANMKGIDLPSLEMLQRAGISAVRRAKLRNMERLTLACGGRQMNSVENLTPDCLGFAGHVWETAIGDDHWTYIEDVKDPRSVTILMRGPNNHTLKQMQDAVRDGLRAVNNAIKDGCAIAGAGAFEVALCRHLNEYKKQVTGKNRLGVEAFAEALLEIPRALAQNGGHDAVDAIVNMQAAADKGEVKGLDIETGGLLDPIKEGIWDNYCVKREQLQSGPLVATQLLLVDEVLRAGVQMQK
jgi:T-complex protein 1 subunit zeta